MEQEILDQCNACGSKDIIAVNEQNNICQCNNCDYVFDSPRPTIAEITAYYSKIDKYDSWLGEEKARDILWKRRLELVKKDKKKGRLLDVGTGIGQFLHFAKKDFEVYGTEISELNKNGILMIAVPNDIVNYRTLLAGLLRNIPSEWPGAFLLPIISLDNPHGEVHLSHFQDHVLKRLLMHNGFKVTRNTLDPYYAEIGGKKLKEDLRYLFWDLYKKIFNKNLYNCIWMSAILQK